MNRYVKVAELNRRLMVDGRDSLQLVGRVVLLLFTFVGNWKLQFHVKRLKWLIGITFIGSFDVQMYFQD